MRSWDASLLDLQDARSLVTIARQRRLVLEDDHGPRRVELCWVDEVALALIDLAIGRKQSVAIVYPAPAGQVAVILAAQLLLHQFVRGVPSPSVGIVTADASLAAGAWDSLRIATTGGREPVSDVFPCFRAGPEGESPWGRNRRQGVIVGRRCEDWPVDHLVVDHLAGFVAGRLGQPSIEVFSDPLDKGLRRVEEEGRLIWGWTQADLSAAARLVERPPHTVPFSVATDRLLAMAKGVDVAIVVCAHPPAESAIGRVREDLRLLRSLSARRIDRNFERGLSVAWHHLTTLISLPCAPSAFDRFAGIPPIAARSTRTFERELEAWAKTLPGDTAEIATILASDIGDLRAALEDGNPIERSIRELYERGDDILVVTRTITGSKALLATLRVDPNSGTAGRLTVCPLGRLHRQGTAPRAVMIGEPSPWDWHRLLSGLAAKVEILALGERSAVICASAVSEMMAARDRWGALPLRAAAWRGLVGTEPPPAPRPVATPNRTTLIVDGAEHVPEPDPFESLTSLFDLEPLDIGGEGPRSGLARENEDGGWTAEVLSVEVSTDHGRIFLELGRPVEVRVGPRIVDKRPELLEAGDALLVGKAQGRVGLIEALEERLADRPDLLAARLLVEGYRQLVCRRFAESRMTVASLHRAVVNLGCDKTSAAVRDWVTDGTMAPQHFDDLERLNSALRLGLSQVHLAELFSGVQRRRGFRRAAGRALANSARDATLVADNARVDTETGLSVADLRDAVVQAVVVAVERCEAPVPLSLIGRLEFL